MNSTDLKVIGFDVIADILHEEEVDTEKLFESTKVVVMMVEAAEVKELQEKIKDEKQEKRAEFTEPVLTEEELQGIGELAEMICAPDDGTPPKRRGRRKKEENGSNAK